jgi:hypothetical protein
MHYPGIPDMVINVGHYHAPTSGDGRHTYMTDVQAKA